MKPVIFCGARRLKIFRHLRRVAMTNICPQFTLEILCTKVLLAFKAQIDAFSSFPFIFCSKLQR